MFRSLRRSDLPMTNMFSIIVGHTARTTMASWRIAEPSDVINLLGSLNQVAATATVAAGDVKTEAPAAMPKPGREEVSDNPAASA